LPDLFDLVTDLAKAFAQADALSPVAVSQRKTPTYKPGIGPNAENDAIRLALDQLKLIPPYRTAKLGQFLPYPDARQKCDLWIGEPLEWAIEVKMARFVGDNGRVDDMAVKDLLSPFAKDRSAVTDRKKLAEADFGCNKAMVIYGFEIPERPLNLAIAAFETLARAQVELGPRHEQTFGPLVHQYHSMGRLFGWAIS